VALKLYNTLTRAKEVFAPLDAANVRFYVCGPTVYDFAHIGNARPVIVFDVLYRLLRYLYGPEHVTYVRNITDVDDKINARAAQEYPGLPLNEAIRRVTEKTEAQFHADMSALGALDPNVEPRATEHIAQMKAMIEQLIENGCAYVAEDHVLFDVASMPDYGKLSGRSLDEMIAGARVEVAPYKRDPMDFVLWKPSKPGEPSWPSPAGIAAPGRPGWHIECSAMADRWLWEEAKPMLSQAGLSQPHMFDIHGGGIDLVFPHHENEIAQSRCAYATPIMAQVWMHNGFLQVEGEKMAKSAGNFVTVHELLTGWHGMSWHGEIIRLAMLMTHYRQPLDFSLRRLQEAESILDRWYRSMPHQTVPTEPLPEVMSALEDDLNTWEAINTISTLIHEPRGPRDPDRALAWPRKAGEIKASANLLGLLNGSFDEWHRWKKSKIEVSDDDVRYLITARTKARAAKDFKEADRIRDELAAMGIALKDAKDPKTGELTTTWEVAR
jgi:cysteinyl-tRNA synthetase